MRASVFKLQFHTAADRGFDGTSGLGTQIQSRLVKDVCLDLQPYCAAVDGLLAFLKERGQTNPERLLLASRILPSGHESNPIF